MANAFIGHNMLDEVITVFGEDSLHHCFERTCIKSAPNSVRRKKILSMENKTS